MNIHSTHKLNDVEHINSYTTNKMTPLGLIHKHSPIDVMYLGWRVSSWRVLLPPNKIVHGIHIASHSGIKLPKDTMIEHVQSSRTPSLHAKMLTHNLYIYKQ